MSLISQKHAASAREGVKRKRQQDAVRATALTRELRPHLKAALQAACEGYPGIELDELPDYLVEALIGMGFQYKPGKRSYDIEARLQRAENDLERELQSEMKRAMYSAKRMSVLSLTLDIGDAPPPVRDFLALLRSFSPEMLEWPNGALWRSVPSDSEIAAFAEPLQERERQWDERKHHLESRLTQLRRSSNGSTLDHAQDWPLLQSWVKQGIVSPPASWALWKAHIGDDDGGRHSMAGLRKLIRRDPQPLLQQLKISALGRAEESASRIESDLRAADKNYRVAHRQSAQMSHIERLATSLRSARVELDRLQGKLRTLQKRFASAPPPPNAVLSWTRASRGHDVVDGVVNPWLMRWLSSESGQATLKAISRAIHSEARRGGHLISLALKSEESSWAITLNARKLAEKSPLTPTSLRAILRHHGYQVEGRMRAGEAHLDVTF